ncbi:MAG: pyridoxal-dependent decarboxylase [Candidatus Nanopelagicales bacterium]
MTQQPANPAWNRDLGPMLERTLLHAEGWLSSLPDRPVAPAATPAEMFARFDEPLPEGSMAAVEVVDLLARLTEPGLTAFGSGRFFGFVIGGTVPAALGADLLATAWDQNAGLRAVTPAAAVVEEVAGGWIRELLGLPAQATVGFVTGGNMASFSGLAAARHHVLAATGWDVERDGLQGAPPVRVIAGRDRHATIDTSLRYLGLGAGATQLVATDAQARIDVDDLRRTLESAAGPTIVCLAAGNVNTGSFDEFEPAITVSHEHGAWVHVDGAFGLWAAASPQTRALTAGVNQADSWSTDAHKWLNVPYDSGLVIVAHPDSHRATFGVSAAYLVQDKVTADPMDLVPEFSRRARGFAVWAALKSLGRQGVVELGDRLCAMARQMAEQLAEIEGCRVVNDVVLNQVLVRFDDSDAITQDVVRRVVSSGDAYVGPSTFKEQSCMRISVCNGWTTSDDIKRTADVITKSLRSARAG